MKKKKNKTSVDVKALRKEWSALKEEYNTEWRAHHVELSDYLFPRSAVFDEGETQNNGAKRGEKVLDGTGIQALATLAAGMLSGLTPASRPWLKYKVGALEVDRARARKVEEWFQHTARITQDALQSSNFYSVAYACYKHQGSFGTGAVYIEEVARGEVNFIPFQIGSYVVDSKEAGVVDRFFREFYMRAYRIVDRFGEDKVSEQVKNLADNPSTKMKYIKVIQAIVPNKTRVQSIDKPFLSVYFEETAPLNEETEPLQEGFYEEFPVAVPRWDTIGSEVMGRSPGMDALSSVKMLMVMQKEIITALSMQIRPPMNAPPSLRGQQASLVPGSITYMDNMGGAGRTFTPSHVPSPDIREFNVRIEQTKSEIKEYFYADLFRLLTRKDAQKNMTATEVVEKVSERLSILAPVIVRQQKEFITPVIDRVFGILLRAGKFPEMPEELRGAKVDIEVMSILAQAQKQVSIENVEQWFQFITQIQPLKPDVVDTVDVDGAVAEYADRINIPAHLLVPAQEVQEIRSQRAQAQQSEQTGDNLIRAAGGAKDASGAKLEEDSVLKNLIESVGGQGNA